MELEAAIKVVLTDVESNERDVNGLLECVLCTEVESCQDKQGVLSDVMMLASCDPKVLQKPILADVDNKKLAIKHQTNIPMHLHRNNVTIKEQSPNANLGESIHSASKYKTIM